MGASLKSIQRIMEMTEAGQLPYGAKICDIGTTQLFGAGVKEAARSMLDYYARCAPESGSRQEAKVTDSQLSSITDGSFIGELLIMAGFRYTALDIFKAPNTILYDLNLHAPGPNLQNRFDLVMNFGTTEHVFNQLNAFRTIHQLTKVNGVMYHDLPMAGYLNHCFFHYDQLFFKSLAPVNKYKIDSIVFSVGNGRLIPDDLRSLGLSIEAIHDVGIEAILIKTKDTPFFVPLEQTTSLAIEPMPSNAVDGMNVIYADQKAKYSPPPGILKQITVNSKKLLRYIPHRWQ
jgi:SAM-dependent methyltransferase